MIFVFSFFFFFVSKRLAAIHVLVSRELNNECKCASKNNFGAAAAAVVVSRCKKKNAKVRYDYATSSRASKCDYQKQYAVVTTRTHFQTCANEYSSKSRQ